MFNRIGFAVIYTLGTLVSVMAMVYVFVMAFN